MKQPKVGVWNTPEGSVCWVWKQASEAGVQWERGERVGDAVRGKTRSEVKQDLSGHSKRTLALTLSDTERNHQRLLSRGETDLTWLYLNRFSLASVLRIDSRARDRLPRWVSSKEPACSAGDTGSIPGSGRSPGGRHSNPLQCYCLENPTDRRAWQATVCKCRKESDTTEALSTHTGGQQDQGNQLKGYHSISSERWCWPEPECKSECQSGRCWEEAEFRIVILNIFWRENQSDEGNERQKGVGDGPENLWPWQLETGHCLAALGETAAVTVSEERAGSSDLDIKVVDATGDPSGDARS